MNARTKSGTTVNDCGRCGAPLGMHWESPPGQARLWVGCPFPPEFLNGRQTCAFLNCDSEGDTDDTFGLCPEHRIRAERGLASRAWKTDPRAERRRTKRTG